MQILYMHETYFSFNSVVEINLRYKYFQSVIYNFIIDQKTISNSSY